MDFLQWAALGTVTVALVAVGSVLVRLMDRLNKAETSATAATITVAANGLEIERVEKDLVEHRVEVAREYVSRAALRDSESRILDAIKHLSERLDGLFSKREHA